MQTVPKLGIYQSATNPEHRLAVVESFGDDVDDPGRFETDYWVTLRRIDDLGRPRSEEIELARAHWEDFVRQEQFMHVGALPSILAE